MPNGEQDSTTAGGLEARFLQQPSHSEQTISTATGPGVFPLFASASPA